MTVPTNPHLLIDADIMVYRCGFAAEKTKYLVEPPYPMPVTHHDSAKEAKEQAEKFQGSKIWSRKEVQPVEFAIQNLKTTIAGISSALWPGSPEFKGDFFLTGKGNFRELIRATKEYKDNRDPSHRPKHYRALKEYLVEKCGAMVAMGQEADDAIGQAAYGMGPDDYVVVSNDKDLDQIAGWHYDWTKKETYYVNEEDALKFFYVQLLTGDPTDNIGGILSRAKAEERIRECQTPKDCAEACREAYKEKVGEDYFNAMNSTANLVWIRRAEDGKDGYFPPIWTHLNG